MFYLYKTQKSPLIPFPINSHTVSFQRRRESIPVILDPRLRGDDTRHEKVTQR
jgi:hypothetical protein